MPLTAVRPEEHCRLTVLIGTLLGMPAWSAAMRAPVAPPPGGRTLPTCMSPINVGSRPTLEYEALRTAERSSSGRVSLKPPFLPYGIAAKPVRQRYYSNRPNHDRQPHLCHRRTYRIDDDYIVIILLKNLGLCARGTRLSRHFWRMTSASSHVISKSATGRYHVFSDTDPETRTR